jgi:hypothetical protein
LLALTCLLLWRLCVRRKRKTSARWLRHHLSAHQAVRRTPNALTLRWTARVLPRRNCQRHSGIAPGIGRRTGTSPRRCSANSSLGRSGRRRPLATRVRPRSRTHRKRRNPGTRSEPEPLGPHASWHALIPSPTLGAVKLSALSKVKRKKRRVILRLDEIFFWTDST